MHIDPPPPPPPTLSLVWRPEACVMPAGLDASCVSLVQIERCGGCMGLKLWVARCIIIALPPACSK